MSFRPGSRIFNAFRSTFRQPFMFRRMQSTAPPAEERTGFAKLWHSPVGPKTVHFWAPVMKWALVLAGASDFTRPADQLSLNTNFALMCTGAIWTRWCLIIRPKNVFLGAVNFFLFLVGGTQVIRILLYQRSAGAAKEEAKVEAAELKEGLEKTKEKAETALKR